MGVHLTDRDYRIFNLLTDQGFALFEQIQAVGFPSSEATRLRLAALQKEGWIHSESLPVPSSIRQWMREIWGSNSSQITYGLKNRKIYKPGKTSQLREGVDRTDKMIRHQLGLNRTIERLMIHFKSPVILTESDILHEDRVVYASDAKLLPDLVFEEGDIKLAVELERNVKSRKKYFERFYRYKRSPLYSHVLYVCENQIIFDALTKQSKVFPEIGFTLLHDLSKVMTGMGWMPMQVFLG